MENISPMRYTIGFGIVMSVVNLILVLFLAWYGWRLCPWPFACELYSGPYEFSERTLSLQLGILQATLVGIGVGLTIMGVISFRSIQEAAVEKAEKAAEKTAAKTTEEFLASRINEPVSPGADVPTGTDPLDQEPEN